MRHTTLARRPAELCRAPGIVGLLVLVLFQWSPELQAEPPRAPLKLDQIIESMEALGERAGAVRVRWRETTQIKAGGALSAGDAKALQIEGPVATTGIPPQPMRADFPSELLLKGSWMRLVTRNCAEREAGGFSFADEISAYDGVESRVLLVREKGVKDGSIMRRTENFESRAARIVPLMLYLRPFAQPFNVLVKEKVKIQDADVVVKGRHCVLIADRSKLVWIDPARACIPIQFEEKDGKGATYVRGDIEYAEHDKLFWTPVRCRVEVFDTDDPGPHRSGRRPAVATTVCELNAIVVEPRLSLEQRDFGLIFPVGTAVYDQRNRQRYRVGPDGAKEPIGGRRKPKG